MDYNEQMGIFVDKIKFGLYNIDTLINFKTQHKSKHN